jgi:hypothetical protein
MSVPSPVLGLILGTFATTAESGLLRSVPACGRSAHDNDYPDRRLDFRSSVSVVLVVTIHRPHAIAGQELLGEGLKGIKDRLPIHCRDRSFARESVHCSRPQNL